jgi:hypothetical protein
MTSPNFPDPDKIPDMSLGERSERPAPPAKPTDGDPWSLQPHVPSPPQKIAADPTPTSWQEGDDVLAPWEPNALYPGVIKEILRDDAKGDQALIEYDDGGEGWVFLYSLCPFEFKAGQQVFVRRYRTNAYYSGAILDVSKGEVRVQYDDGSAEWTPLATLRIPCVENGPGAVMTKLAPWQSPPGASINAPRTGLPQWAIWAGLVFLYFVVRIGCQMQH